MNELTDIVTVFAWDSAQGILTSLQDISTELPGYAGVNHRRRSPSPPTEDSSISPTGVWVKTMFKGQIRESGCLAIDPAKGTLTLVEHAPTGGIMPRNFAN